MRLRTLWIPFIRTLMRLRTLLNPRTLMRLRTWLNSRTSMMNFFIRTLINPCPKTLNPCPTSLNLALNWTMQSLRRIIYLFVLSCPSWNGCSGSISGTSRVDAIILNSLEGLIEEFAHSISLLMPLIRENLVTILVYMCIRWTMCFSSLPSSCLDPQGTKAIILSKDRSFLYPKNPLLKAGKGIYDLYNQEDNYRNLDQFIPAKKGWALIYSTPLTPSRSLGSEISFLIKSAACGLTSASFGMTKYFLQFWILCHVYLGYSEAKGG